MTLPPDRSHVRTEARNPASAGLDRLDAAGIATLMSDDHRAVADAVEVPVIASGGAGCIDHIAAALQQGQAAAALLASLLHDGVLTVEAIKQDLLGRGLPLRPLLAPPSLPRATPGEIQRAVSVASTSLSMPSRSSR